MHHFRWYTQGLPNPEMPYHRIFSVDCNITSMKSPASIGLILAGSRLPSAWSPQHTVLPLRVRPTATWPSVEQLFANGGFGHRTQPRGSLSPTLPLPCRRPICPSIRKPPALCSQHGNAQLANETASISGDARAVDRGHRAMAAVLVQPPDLGRLFLQGMPVAIANGGQSPSQIDDQTGSTVRLLPQKPASASTASLAGFRLSVFDIHSTLSSGSLGGPLVFQHTMPATG